jgi:hypothetical protein
MVTLAEITDPAERLAFVARAMWRQKPRQAPVIASAAPVSAPAVAQPKATKKALTVADLTDAERDRVAVAFHESGHSVAGVALGGTLHTAVVSAGARSRARGHTAFRELPDAHNAAMTFAGPWAHARWIAGQRPTSAHLWRVMEGCDRSDGRGDYQLLCASVGGIAGAPAVVEPLLERCWPAVVKVAQQLFRTGEIFHEDVCAALEIPPDDNGHHLALIRSGSVPGSFTVTPAAV